MWNALLSWAHPSPEAIRLWLYYGVCFALIFVAFTAIGIHKRHTKKELRAERVRRSCIKAKRIAAKMLAVQEKKEGHIILASPKLSRLSGQVANAAWYAFQIVDAKKDIVFEGVANEIDKLATELSTESEDGYIPVEEYKAYLKKTVTGLETVVEKIDRIIKNR